MEYQNSKVEAQITNEIPNSKFQNLLQRQSAGHWDLEFEIQLVIRISIFDIRIFPLYTALLLGMDNGVGVGIVEVYDRGAAP